MIPYKYEFKVDTNPRLAYSCFEQPGPGLSLKFTVIIGNLVISLDGNLVQSRI